MAKAITRGKSGNLKKASDRRRTVNFRSRHMALIARGHTITPISESDDPLGFQNNQILQELQRRYS